MSEGKMCGSCLAKYPPGHWAASRTKCPACGGALTSTRDCAPQLDYEHYDSSADIQFDLEELLSPTQRREMHVIMWLGLALLLLAFGARLGFVYLGGLEGFWKVPIWFDVIVLAMIVLALVMSIWAGRRLSCHRKAMKRHG